MVLKTASVVPPVLHNVTPVELDIEIVEKIRAAWDSHAAECEQPPKAILLHPGNHVLVGWNEVFGLPVLPDQRLEPMCFRLVCGTGKGGFCAEGDVYWDEDGRPYVEIPAEEPS